MGGCNKLLRGCVNDDLSWLHTNTDAGYFRPSWYKYSKRLWHSEVAIMTMEEDMAKSQNSRSEGRYGPAHKMSNTKKNSLDEIEDIIFRRNEDFRIQSVEHATAALSHLNANEGVDYELVKPGLIGGASISRSMIFHTNFKAKCKGDPDARVQTFFVQIRLMTDKPGDTEECVDCCVNLGPSGELPEKVYNGGCRYCDDSDVYHPIGGCLKLLLGCENDDKKWLFGDHSECF
ncbi:uncharacterized protein LOC141651977 [Silene latifolia]|uniref:uncharacterized protein LOC141651977 n=1 Tax=Silene latifolia TaxID=37657 RepID=UPI003D77A2A5